MTRYNRTALAQLGICKVKIEHNNKHKICHFFVVPGSEQVLLGMSGIDILDILTMNCNTIDTHKANRAIKCITNTANCQGSRCEQHYKNMMQEADSPKIYYTNTEQQFKI